LFVLEVKKNTPGVVYLAKKLSFFTDDAYSSPKFQAFVLSGYNYLMKKEFEHCYGEMSRMEDKLPDLLSLSLFKIR